MIGTRIKTFFVTNPLHIEDELNSWLTDNDIEIHQILPYPLMKDKEPTLMIILVYSKETWK